MDYQNFFTSITTSTITSTFFSGLVTIALNAWIKGKINLNYDKKIEKFKDELDELSQNRRLDFERKIHDFSLYSSKKHEIYPELYKLLVNIKRMSVQCTVDNEIPISLKDNGKAINIYLIEMGVPEEKRNELLIKWDQNKNINEMSKVIFLIKVNELSNSLTKVRDFFFSNEIYFSEELATKGEFILNEFQSVVSVLIFKIELNKEIEYPYKLIDKIDLELQLIRAKIKDELAIADYEVNK